MKKIFILFLISILTINLFVVSSAATQPIPITMYFNGGFVATEVDPFNKDGITYVTLRSFTDLLNIQDVEWDGEERSVGISYSGKSLKFYLDQNIVLVNGREYFIDGQPTLVNGNTMVPLDFIAHNFDCDISWDSLTQSLYVKKEGISIKMNDGGYSSEDVLWLARIVQVEGNGTPYDCKLAIANVVLNRVKSGVFPDSVKNVIFHHGQFPPAYKAGFSESIPRDENIYVAKMALNGDNNISTCLYFNNRPFKSKADDLYKIIDGEYFYN